MADGDGKVSAVVETAKFAGRNMAAIEGSGPRRRRYRLLLAFLQGRGLPARSDAFLRVHIGVTGSLRRLMRFLQFKLSFHCFLRDIISIWEVSEGRVVVLGQELVVRRRGEGPCLAQHLAEVVLSCEELSGGLRVLQVCHNCNGKERLASPGDQLGGGLDVVQTNEFV